ncbi:MAG: hypothetical protein ACRBFS_07280 [Aureispira sp.]
MRPRHYFFLSNLLITSLLACEPTPPETTKEQPIVETTTDQETPISTIQKINEDGYNAVEAFIGAGQTLLREVEGDLNNDGIPDKVIVLENPANKAQPDELSPPRSLVILQGNPQGQYRLWASSDKVVLCAQCGGIIGDPFRTIQIDQEAIILQQDGGSRERWERNSSIALHPTTEEWIIVKDKLTVVDTYDASKNSQQNMLEGEQLSLEQYNVYAGQ